MATFTFDCKMVPVVYIVLDLLYTSQLRKYHDKDIVLFFIVAFAQLKILSWPLSIFAVYKMKKEGTEKRRIQNKNYS